MSNDISSIINNFSDLRILVLGDVMVDHYLWGETDRISPEAPVPIVDIYKKEFRPGGAANVAMNIKALGATPIICTVTGKDTAGETLRTLLNENGVITDHLIESPDRITTKKSRVFGGGQQILRVDQEVTADLNPKDQDTLKETISTVIESENVDLVLIQDYNKGVLTPEIIDHAITLCQSNGIPISVDPKHRNFFEYKAATLFKPNLKEVTTALNADPSNIQLSDLVAISKKLKELLNNKITLITLAEKGVFVSDDKEHRIIPSSVRSISDVSGAGDTVISVASLCLAAGSDMITMATLSNLAGGLACEKLGVKPLERAELLEATKL